MRTLRSVLGRILGAAFALATMGMVPLAFAQTGDRITWNQEAPNAATAQAYTYRVYQGQTTTTPITLAAVVCQAMQTGIGCSAPRPVGLPLGVTFTLTSQAAGENESDRFDPLATLTLPQATTPAPRNLGYIPAGGGDPIPVPPSPEVCGDGLDNDGDGLVDEDCPPEPVTITLPSPGVVTADAFYTLTVSRPVASVRVDILDGQAQALICSCPTFFVSADPQTGAVTYRYQIRGGSTTALPGAYLVRALAFEGGSQIEMSEYVEWTLQ